MLARKALALWPDCADGYVLLAQAASSLEEARELLERGVAAGERAVGRRVFVEDAGDFWLIFETRPYMRAGAALGRLGRREEAVEHQRELLRLNPRGFDQHRAQISAKWINTVSGEVSRAVAPADRARVLGVSPARVRRRCAGRCVKLRNACGVCPMKCDRARFPASPDRAYCLQAKERIGGNRACITLSRELLKRSYHILRELGDQVLELASCPPLSIVARQAGDQPTEPQPAFALAREPPRRQQQS